MAGSLVFLWFWGILLGGIALTEAGEGGKKVYQKRCQACHAADGAGNKQMAKLLHVSIPPVTGATLESEDDAALLHIIAEGKGKMPGYAKTLSVEEQRQVLEYIKTLGR
jgi:mono/diheme cytochrome c family protein